jgi:hypothetical protein
MEFNQRWSEKGKSVAASEGGNAATACVPMP